MKRLIYLFLGITLFAASCTTAKNNSANLEAKSANSGLTSSEWRLVTLYESTDIKQQATLNIGADGKIHGRGSCNSFSGTAIIKGSNIKFGKVAKTLSACLDMQLETLFFKALEETDSYIVEQGNLKLKKGNTVIATFATNN